MTKLLREYRLVPIVLIAIGTLFALKAAGLLFDGGYTLGQRLSQRETMVVRLPSTPLQSPASPLDSGPAQPTERKPSWMQEMFNYPDVTGSLATSRSSPKDPIIVTGSAAASKPAPANKEPPVGQVQPPDTKPAAGAPPAAAAQPPAPAPPGTPVSLDPSRPGSAAERAILERLHQRRQEIDARAREIELRENLLKAAEKKLEARMLELKEMEARINAGLQKKDDADAARLKGIVTMYETMKPKDAAKIFDRLDAKVLLEVVTQINPRRMSEIMASMTPETAERLTVELASRANAADKASNPGDLPKIDGKPGGGT